MDILTHITGELARTLQRPVEIRNSGALGGGSINAAFRLDTSAGRFFVKLNQAQAAEMFAAEAAGLEELAAAEALRIPRPIAQGVAGGRAWLALEHLELSGPAAPARLGEALARLHRHSADAFGWTRDNTIGSTPQCNARHSEWIAFWRDCRLGPQLRLAESDGAPHDLLTDGERLLEVLPAFFDGYRPQCSLLHGDLWSGNWGYGSGGEPTIFDPAVYYGDREADIAMTELFGSPGAAFYDAYDVAWPRDPGYGVRRTLYNLYHILNHHHLFGAGYGAQAGRMISELLAEVGG
jgi:protein-ribulosamine 3-kinase